MQKDINRMIVSVGHAMNKCSAGLVTLLVLLAGLGGGTCGAAMSGINMTKHNLSVTGPGPIKALSETRICIFCHTPHNAAPMTPLWNRDVSPRSYELYSSTTMVAGVSQPMGPSRLCLSCHDGTVALGTVLHPSEGIAVSGAITSGMSSYIGSLAYDHPISFSYYAAASDPQIRAAPPPNLTLYGQGNIECSTCHDPHDDRYGMFLVMDNRGSALCIECHDMKDWDLCAHKTSLKTLPAPLSGLEWTNWTTVADYGCEGCHVMHNAGGQQRLLRYQEEEQNCYDCHNGTVADNVYSEFQKTSRHPVELTTGIHQPNESPTEDNGNHVECVDCHDPHAVNGNGPIQPGGVSGMTQDVNGMDMTRSAVEPAVYQYQICFKCHASLNPTLAFITRWESTTNMQAAFDVSNRSYHPIEAPGHNTDVPSLISVTQTVPALNLTTSSVIYCTDCHDSDDSSALPTNSGPRGPHGSIYPPILRERYSTTISLSYSAGLYALCYRCHSSTSIMNNDSFKQTLNTSTGLYEGGHSGHLQAGVPCSVCHDPHGVSDNYDLINFDTHYVDGPSAGVPPAFTTAPGTHSGSCTLVCHMPSGDITHSNASYP